MKNPPFVVAEVSKTWINGRSFSAGLLCQQFEHIIEVNRKRGYRLMQFSMHSVCPAPDSLTETIVAVFEKVKP